MSDRLLVQKHYNPHWTQLEYTRGGARDALGPEYQAQATELLAVATDGLSPSKLDPATATPLSE